MTEKHKVLRSIETPGGGRCVDIFQRADGTFGFEEYRRDVEDGRGWFPVGFYARLVHDSERAAYGDALDCVPWLKDVPQHE